MTLETENQLRRAIDAARQGGAEGRRIACQIFLNNLDAIEKLVDDKEEV